MSKNKHGDLFNTSLTEIIIILFFVLMLFALFNIDKVNKENMVLGDEVDSITTILIIEKERADTNEEIANASPETLGPINTELTRQIADLKQEKQQLEEEIERLTPEDEPIDILEEPPIEPSDDLQIAGNCIDKTFWRACADWAWPVETARVPPAEFLFDIGMCGAGDIVVIKSDWEKKQEADFNMVGGASAITNKMYIKRNEIIEFMSLIHDKSLDFKEEQTQHVARLINLEKIDTDTSKFPRKAIGDEMNYIPITRFDKKYEAIKSRFPKNACGSFKSIKEVEVDTPQNPSEDKTPQNPSEDKTPQNPSEDNLVTDIKPLPSDISASSKASFSWDNNFVCKRADRKRNSEFKATFNLLITANSRVKVQNYTYEKTNKNNRLVILDVKAAIEKQRKNIKPAINTQNPEDNKISLKVKFVKDICR